MMGQRDGLRRTAIKEKEASKRENFRALWKKVKPEWAPEEVESRFRSLLDEMLTHTSFLCSCVCLLLAPHYVRFCRWNWKCDVCVDGNCRACHFPRTIRCSNHPTPPSRLPIRTDIFPHPTQTRGIAAENRTAENADRGRSKAKT